MVKVYSSKKIISKLIIEKYIKTFISACQLIDWIIDWTHPRKSLPASSQLSVGARLIMSEAFSAFQSSLGSLLGFKHLINALFLTRPLIYSEQIQCFSLCCRPFEIPFCPTPCRLISETLPTNRFWILLFLQSTCLLQSFSHPAHEWPVPEPPPLSHSVSKVSPSASPSPFASFLFWPAFHPRSFLPFKSPTCWFIKAHETVFSVC